MKIEIEMDDLLEKLKKAYRDGFSEGYIMGMTKVQCPTTQNPTVTWGPGIREVPLQYKDYITTSTTGGDKKDE